MSIAESLSGNLTSSAVLSYECLKLRYRLEDAIEEAKSLSKEIDLVEQNYNLVKKDVELFSARNHMVLTMKQTLKSLEHIRQGWDCYVQAIEPYLKELWLRKNPSGNDTREGSCNWTKTVQSLMAERFGKDQMAINKVRANSDAMMDTLSIKMSEQASSIRDESKKLSELINKSFDSFGISLNDRSLLDLKLPQFDDLVTPPSSQGRGSECEQYPYKLDSSIDQRSDLRANVAAKKEQFCPPRDIRASTPQSDTYEVEKRQKKSNLATKTFVDLEEECRGSPVVSQEKREGSFTKLDLMREEFKKSDDLRKTPKRQDDSRSGKAKYGSKRPYTTDLPLMNLDSMIDSDSVFGDQENQLFRSNKRVKGEDTEEDEDTSEFAFFTQGNFSANLQNIMNF